MGSVRQCRNRSRPRVQQALDDRLAVAGRQVDRQALGAERLLDLRDQRLQVHLGHVDLVDDDRRGRLRSLAASIMRRVTTSMPLWR